jgi:hypothetical protein
MAANLVRKMEQTQRFSVHNRACSHCRLRPPVRRSIGRRQSEGCKVARGVFCGAGFFVGQIGGFRHNLSSPLNHKIPLQPSHSIPNIFSKKLRVYPIQSVILGSENINRVARTLCPRVSKQLIEVEGVQSSTIA